VLLKRPVSQVDVLVTNDHVAPSVSQVDGMEAGRTLT
jgi:hypothetical protein